MTCKGNAAIDRRFPHLFVENFPTMSTLQATLMNIRYQVNPLLEMLLLQLKV